MVQFQGERASLIARSCLLLFFSVTVNFCAGSLVLAQETGSGQGLSTYAEENLPGELALISYLLQHRKELNLSTTQIKNLESEQTLFQKLSQKKRAELQVVEAQLNQQRTAETLDLNAIEEKVKQSDAIKTEIRIAAIKAIEKAKAFLQPDQRNKLDPLLKAGSIAVTQGSSPDPNLRQQIETVLKEQYKDQKHVELETSEAVVTKLISWATTFGVVLGVPVTLILAFLGLFGLKSLSDVRALLSTTREDFAKMISNGKQEFSKSVKDANKEIKTLVSGSKQDIEEKLKEALQDAETARTKGDAIIVEYEKLETQLAQVQELSKTVPELKRGLKALTNKVESIEEEIKVEFINASSSHVKKIISTLKPYQEYFRTIGFPPAKGELDILITGEDEHKHNAFYEPEKNRLVIGEAVVHDPDVINHEYTHHILARNADQKVTTSRRAYGIQEGLADYFACSFKGKPEMGEKSVKAFRKLAGKDHFPAAYIRTLNNKRSFEELKTTPKMQERVMEVGNIWGGAFWEIRDLLGQQKADKLILTTWSALKPADIVGQFPVKFVKTLLKTYQPDGDGKGGKEIQAIFERRGLKLG